MGLNLGTLKHIGTGKTINEAIADGCNRLRDNGQNIQGKLEVGKNIFIKINGGYYIVVPHIEDKDKVYVDFSFQSRYESDLNLEFSIKRD